ncbi:MAG TPA: hypothetical protein VK086_00240 [Ruania sp.]|nr:hypothetical protein [Ruania sp.]
MSQPYAAAPAVKVNVERRTGITVFQVTKARMEWTAQNRIRVLDFTPSGEQVAFDAAANEIIKARLWPGFGPTNGGELSFATAAGKVKVDPRSMILSPEPGETAEQYDQRLSTTPIPPPRWWIEQLKAYGVDAKAYSFMKIFGLTFLITIAVLVVIMIAALVFS